MKKTQTVLIVDDERLPMKGYVDALQNSKFKVRQCFNPDESLDYLREHSATVCAIVLDVMLPAGRKFANRDTINGLITGFHLYRDIKARCPHVPFVFLTNVSNDDTLRLALQSFRDVEQVTFLRKMDCFPEDLVGWLQCLLQKNQSGSAIDLGRGRSVAPTV